MNKKLLAAAITAGLMVPGLAAADVKLSGVIQAETGNIDIDTQGAGGDTSTTHMGDGGSGAIFGGGNNQINISGSEKLGNGLTAYFKTGHTPSTFDNRGTFDSRDTYVGIKGDGWHVQFGTMNSLYKASSVKYDPLVTTGLQCRAHGCVSGLHNGYNEDVGEVGFKSGGFSGGVQLTWSDRNGEKNTTGNADGNNFDSGSWNGAVKYAANGWEAGMAYIDVDYGAGNGDMDMWKVHGKWSGNGFTIMGQYEDGDASGGGTPARSNSGSSAFSPIVGALGAIGTPAVTPFGEVLAHDEWQSLLIAAQYKISDATTLHGRFADTEAGEVTGAGNNDVDGTHWAVAVTHNLSKRTSVYGGYADNSFDVKSGKDVDTDAWAVGLQHKF